MSLQAHSKSYLNWTPKLRNTWKKLQAWTLGESQITPHSKSPKDLRSNPVDPKSDLAHKDLKSNPVDSNSCIPKPETPKDLKSLLDSKITRHSKSYLSLTRNPQRPELLKTHYKSSPDTPNPIPDLLKTRDKNPDFQTRKDLNSERPAIKVPGPEPETPKDLNS